jgi:hypothetical protein
MEYKIRTDADVVSGADVAADADEIGRLRNPTIIRNAVPTRAVICRLLLGLLAIEKLLDWMIFITFLPLHAT